MIIGYQILETVTNHLARRSNVLCRYMFSETTDMSSDQDKESNHSDDHEDLHELSPDLLIKHPLQVDI